jgi:hypothetical protein
LATRQVNGHHRKQVMCAAARSRRPIGLPQAYLELPLSLVQAAISYYGAYRDEIDQWIEANEQQLAEAHAAWSAGQDAVRQ